MDTLVCVQAIVPEPPRVRDDEDGPAFEPIGSLGRILNESDAYAVDEAVLLAKRHGGRVTAVTVGPIPSQDALYSALAKGADDAIRVDADPGDPLVVAELLAAVARRGRYDLILTGIESWEALSSAVGPALAAHLDLPFAGAVCGIELESGRAVVTREMGAGYFERLELTLPAVLCIQSGICPLRYPPTMRVLQARRRPPRSVSMRELGIDAKAPTATRVAVSRPRREREVEIVEGDPEEVARVLLDRIEAALTTS